MIKRYSVAVKLFLIISAGLFFTVNTTESASLSAEEYRQRDSHQYSDLEDRIVAAVKEHADNVLKYGRDRWSGQNTPLFADGLNLQTMEPAIWRFHDNEYFISNFASQQNLLRTFSALSLLTGDSRYRNAAEEVTNYMFEHRQYESGLLPWGGHRFIDLKTLDDVYGFDANQHELKAHFPYYELMFDVDKERATKLVRGIWESHIYDWSNQFFHNRHGEWIDSVPDDIWQRPFINPDAHQIIDRGTMVHTSNDLMYAAAHAYRYNPETEEGALLWARRKGEMWYKARNPVTQLGSYHYHLGFNPQSGWGSHIPGTYVQFEWPEFEKFGAAATSTRLWAREGWPGVIYADATIAQLQIAELLGEDDRQFHFWAHTALRAFAVSDAYNFQTNTINRMLTDGRVIEEDYTTAGISFMLSFSMGYRTTKDDDLWRVARGVARGWEFGDIGEFPGDEPRLNPDAGSTSTEALLAFLELYRALEKREYLEMAITIAENILKENFHQGFFVRSDRHVHVRFDDPHAFALLYLVAFLQGTPEIMPLYANGSAYIHGRFDGEGRTYDTRVIWPETR